MAIPQVLCPNAHPGVEAASLKTCGNLWLLVISDFTDSLNLTTTIIMLIMTTMMTMAGASCVVARAACPWPCLGPRAPRSHNAELAGVVRTPPGPRLGV